MEKRAEIFALNPRSSQIRTPSGNSQLGRTYAQSAWKQQKFIFQLFTRLYNDEKSSRVGLDDENEPWNYHRKEHRLADV